MILIEALHLYPIIYLNTSAALANIDPSLEEQAENLGANGFQLFRTVTMPLMKPGYLAGVVLVFIWVLTDLGTPLIIGYQHVIAHQLFSVALSEYYRSPIAYVMSVIMTAISLFLVAIYRRYIGRMEYARVQAGMSVSRHASKIHGLKLTVCYLFLTILIMMALSPHIGIFLAAFTREWSRTVLPVSYTLKNFELVFSGGLDYIKNSFLYCTAVFIINVSLGAAIGFILVRKNIPGKEILDYLSMLPLAIPGLVIGIGYWRAFMGTILDPFYMAPLVLTISLTMRRLPFTVRAAYAGMLQIPKEYEEASLNIGASRWRTFRSITLPLLLASVIAGGILSFTYAMLEVSTTLILVARGEQATMTWGLFHYSNDPRHGWNVSSAMGAILIVFVALSLTAVSKVFGKQMGALFRVG
jgi:iron(III) transport system permease protein